MKLEVLRPGIHTTIQDLGRTGFRHHGVSVGGALDLIAARCVNLLVGNKESAAVIETALGGLRVRFCDERIIAWRGAPFEVRLSQRSIAAGRASRVSAGDEIVFKAPSSGMRAWLAVSGGIDVPLVLGSRSTDVRGGFGGLEGRVIHEGDALPLGAETARSARLRAVLVSDAVANWGIVPEPIDAALILRVVRGRDAVPAPFFEQFFNVTPDSDRMGLRLAGPAFHGAGAVEISEAVAPGTIQLPPGGQPIVLLADCQTIGGYPRIAHVITADLPRAAQLRPGDEIRFCEVSLDEARELRLANERALERFRTGLELRLA